MISVCLLVTKDHNNFKNLYYYYHLQCSFSQIRLGKFYNYFGKGYHHPPKRNQLQKKHPLIIFSNCYSFKLKLNMENQLHPPPSPLRPLGTPLLDKMFILEIMHIQFFSLSDKFILKSRRCQICFFYLSIFSCK